MLRRKEITPTGANIRRQYIDIQKEGMNVSRREEALARFAGGLLCSQAILITYGREAGMDEQTALRIARPFGSGLARTAEMCGAVTGAMMVLGLYEQGQEEKQAKEDVYRRVQEFSRRFRERNGNLNCGELLGCHLGTAEGQAHFHSEGLLKNCQKYVSDAAEILEELIPGRSEEVRIG